MDASTIANKTVDAAAANTINTAIKATQPKFDAISDFQVTYRDGGRWNSVDLTMTEFMNVLRTGELDERKVCAVKVLVVNSGNEDGDLISFVYDFILLHTERNPWRMI